MNVFKKQTIQDRQFFYKSIVILLLSFITVVSCKQKPSSTENETEQIKLASAPAFNADSAYTFIEKQVKFGPRVPNTSAHVKGGDWMVQKLKEYGFEVTEQHFKPTTFDGKVLNARNIIGSYNPTANKRILLAAHWDSRPFADKDSLKKEQAIDAANDGASGVGILLEVARTIRINQQKLNIGVDIIFFDAEDWGEKDDMQPSQEKVYWCLGSQYWASNLHKPNYSAYFGILLDMVGAQGATFPKEAQSVQFAGNITNQIWDIAERLGYSQYFIKQEGGGITDDHVFVNTVARIPMVDILHQEVNSNRTFGAYHHTHGDNMSIIDKNTLKAVGQTVVQVLYQEDSEAL
ncbi:M28 family peptidase [Emticicia sp. BO119]|uniref:M28 family peptidase n=1 Tax=Emticicia sp. BO119 TaxID=2757768 RepID=UPI0015F0DE94|nr:M28 family peptidase [Emticicia sp. BO119]MBA4852805.1 M28 family peptidase [Emticicia sp. BO119]